MHFSEITDGAFDITYASVGLPLRLPQAREADRSADRGSAARRELPATCCSIEKTHSVRFEHEGMRIDLGGIAKGYAVDRGIGILQKRGVQHAVVTAGGDTRIIGDRFGRPWIVGIRHPDDKNEVITRIPLIDTAMSTSGDYERFFDENGVRYHHIIDPKTRALREQGAQRHDPRADGDADRRAVENRVRARRREGARDHRARCRTSTRSSCGPDGKVLYTKGLQPPESAARS